MARRPELVVIPAVAALALVIVVFALGTASSQVLTTFSLHVQRSAPDAVIDGGMPGPSIGDLAFVKSLLTDDAGDQVGAIIAQISRFSTAGSESHITGTITLKDRGTLILAGKLNLSGRTPNHGTIAIVGGTADFEATQGVATWTVDPGTGRVHLQVSLA